MAPGIAAVARPARLEPRPFSAAYTQPLAASPPRNTTVSMKFLDLYFASRGSTVKSISRAGLAIA